MKTAAAKLKHVNSFTDRHGRPRNYFRHAGKSFSLPGTPGSPEFEAAYAAALAATAPPPKNVVALPQQKQTTSTPIDKATARVAFLAGSIGWVVEQWLKSRAFAAYARNTQLGYRLGLDILRERLGAGLLADLDADNVDIYSAKIANERGTSIADLQVTLISQLWQFARTLPEFKRSGRSNPARGAIKHYSVAKPHQPWPASVQDKFWTAAPASLQTAFMLLLYTGQRRGDVVKMKWADYDEARKTIMVVQEKTGETVPISVHRDLQQYLAGLPREHDNILVHSRAAGYTPASLTVRFHLILTELGLPDYNVHGLRKNAGIALAEAGCTVPQIMAVLGHRTPSMALYYAREANKHTLGAQAMAAWEKADAAKPVRKGRRAA